MDPERLGLIDVIADEDHAEREQERERGNGRFRIFPRLTCSV